MISQSFKSALSTRFSVRCSSLGQRSDRKAIRLGAIPLPSLDLTGRKRPDFDSYQWQPALEFRKKTASGTHREAALFSATIRQQLEMLQSNPSPDEFADRSEAKEAYFQALRAEVPELLKFATGKEARPPELDTFAAAFAVAGEDQEKVADETTAVLLKRVLGQTRR